MHSAFSLIFLSDQSKGYRRLLLQTSLLTKAPIPMFADLDWIRPLQLVSRSSAPNESRQALVSFIKSARRPRLVASYLAADAPR